ncbi:MAG: hypothetical protein M1823_000290 [Watsoniomyces obsoletus]|nr:MAG: hypothetical protein M1823_000290 [Watsoniomyces obsoletus]
MTFGYDAAAAFSKSTAEVIDHAKSLLASLVDKREETEALLQARLESRYEPIRDATRGLIFFGTPHRGSDKAVYGKVLANIAQKLTHKPPSRLLSALQANSDVLLRLTSDFRFQLPDYQVVSFYEQRPMNIFSSLIVDKQSALLEVKHEEQIPVNADHSAMCKFATEDDDTFEKVYKRIQRIRKVSRSPAGDQAVSRAYNEHFEVPHLLSPAFTGHDEICQCMDSSLDLTRQPAVPVQRRFVLYGLGGSGKTQLCVRYAQVNRERYWAVFWIDASTIDSIERGFTEMASRLQAQKDRKSVKRTLSNSTLPWLLIFDNADDPDLSLTPYFPAGDRGNIIITSRNPSCQQYNTVGAKEVGRMMAVEAVGLLVNTAYGTSILQNQQDKGAQEVAETLGCLALAIVQAGAYIRETSCSFIDYLQLYHQRREQVLTYFPHQHIGTDYRYTVYTTWQVSLDMIESRQDAISKHALELLKLLCFYHHDQIPMQMFYRAWHNPSDLPSLPDALLGPQSESGFLDYQRALQASVTFLASFSLVTREANVSLSMHPLVRDWCQNHVFGDGKQAYWQRALLLLARSVAWQFKTEDYSFRRSLMSHVHACLGIPEYKHEASDTLVLWGWPRLAFILGENGSTLDAIGLLEEALALHKSQMGEHHHNTLRLMHDLAFSYYGEVGRHDEALQLIEQALALQKVLFGETNLDTLRSIHTLALFYQGVGRHDEALQLIEQVVALRKSQLGRDHLATLGSMYTLAKIYSDTGRQDEALRLAEEVVARQKGQLGETNPATLRSMQTLARFYRNGGRKDEALRLAEQLVAVRKSQLGEDHPVTLNSMNNLAVCYSEAGRQDEELQLTEQVVLLQKSRLGEDHLDTLESMYNLAKIYSKIGRQDEALRLAEQVVAMRKSQLGEDHPDTLRSMCRLAKIYRDTGRQDEALQLSEQVVAGQKRQLGDKHPNTMNSIKLLASINRQNLETVRPSQHRLSRIWRQFRR